VTLPTRIYALFDYPPEYGLASALSLLFVVITVVALYLQRAVPGAALLRHARRQGRAAATDAARPGALGGVRLRHPGLHRCDRACPTRR
jgi:ABC-type Fe3+ transport system permease subunit